MIRVVVLLAVLVLWFLLGPWVLVAALASLLVPRVRAFLRPEHPWRGLGIALAVVLVLGGIVWLIPDGRLPLPPGAGVLVSPSYVGRPAMARPIDGVEVPQNPHLAPNGASSMHDDAWATDSYAWPGPLGEKPEVDTAWYGIEECASLAFDTQERIIALCGDLSGPRLHVVDPETLRFLTTKDLPDRVDVEGKAPWENLCGGAYFYLDQDDRAVVATTDRQVLAVATSDGDGNADLTVDDSWDLADDIPSDDCMIALLPDWAGRIWFATSKGRVGVVDPETDEVQVEALGEEIANSIATDETGGVYVVTTGALYRLSADAGGRPRVDWRQQYDAGSEQKPGQLSQGSGTTPTLLPGGLVAITDNADPRMHVLFLRRDTGEEVCEAPVFDDGASASDNSLVVVGPASVVVENNYGYASPLSTVLGRTTTPGFARVDLVDGRCKVAWTNDDIVGPTSVAKSSLATGLVYAYTKRHSWWGASAWYLTALDATTGRHVFSVRTGTSIFANNHYSAVTIAPDGSAYAATLGGLVRVRDGG
ncbi:hypothetical protein [Nocardioides taihuensis]|uniref:Pyrroloquinoline-quinone binding quinoprotein n=1 Tax=Nocardioides taihuensis TaxID=1835606 RepID=A0ABW0BS55_9ACTN